MGSHCCKCADSKNQQQRLDSSISNVQNNQLIPTERYNVNSAKKIIQLALQNSKRKSNSNKFGLATNKDGKYKIMASTHNEALDQNISINASPDELKRNDLPFFAEPLTDVRVKVGSRMRLSTDIRSSTMLKVTWFRENKRIQMGGRFFMIDKGNFQSIDILPVIAHDEGQWTCLAENSYGNSTCSFFLSVIIPKIYQLPNFINNVQVLITEAGTVLLECQVFGVPTPLLQWFKDGEEITAGDIFALTTRTNDTTLLGYYSCKAVNCMGIASSLSKAHIITSKSMEISLGVRNFQTSLTRAPMLSNILKKKNCIIGDCIALTCEINFLPESKLYWFNRQGRVSSSEKYQIMEEEGSFSVKITEIDANDEGLWKCVAERGENMTHIMSYDLTILIPKSYSYPKFKEPLKVIISKKGIVSFECKVVGIPTPTLKWYRNDQELKRDDIYCITTTSPLGSYCCVARNCMGEVKSTAELTIETIKNYLRKADLSFSKNANIPYFRRGLENVKAEINSKFRFTVQVDISFRDTLHWYRNDNLIVSSVDYRSVEGKYGEHHLEIEKLKIIDDANWRCVVGNDYGYNETSCYLKLIIPKHYKKPEFLENLKVICTEAGQINLECKIKGVPSPTLQWFNGNVELQQGVIQKITPTNDNDCSLGTYTCQASNCMGTVKNSILLVGISDIFTREKISKTHEISEEPNTQKKEVKDKICIKLSCNNQHIIHDLVQTTDGQVEAIVTDEITKLISGENVTTVPSVKLMLKTFSDESLNYNENSEEKDKDDDNKPNEGSEKKSQNRKCSRDNGAKNDDECTDEEQRKITIQKIGVQIYRSEEELFQKNSNQSITPHYQEHTEGIVSRCNYENLDNKSVESICDFRKTEQASENRERLSNDLHSYLHTITTQLEREGDTYIRNEASEVWEDAEIENEHHVQETNTYENKRKERLENSTEIGEKIGVPCENQNLVYGVQDILCDYRIIDEVEKSKEKLYNESTIHTNQYAKTTELEKEEETQIFERDTDYTKAGNDDIELNIDTVEMQGPLLEKKILNDQSGVVLSIDHDSENELERRTEIGPDFSLLDIREENSQKVMASFGTENICIKNDTKDEKKNKESHHVRAIDTYKNEQDESLEHSTKTIGKITDDDNSCIIDDIELNFDSVGTEGLNELKRHTEINPGFSLSDIKTENIREDIDVVGTEKICTADDMKEEKQNYIGQKNHGLEASDNKRNISILEKDVGKEAEIGNQHYVRAEDPHKNKHEEILEHSTEKIEKNTVPCENRNFANKAQDNLCDFQKIDEVEENGEKLYNEYSDFNLYTDDTELERKGDNQIFNRDTDYTNADDVLYKIDEIELKINTVETQGPLIEKELLDDRSGIISSIDHKSENELEKNSEICPGFSFTDISNENSKKGMDLSEKEKIDITNYTNVERDGEKLYDEYLYPNSYTKTPEDKREEDTQIFNRETDRTNADDDVLCTTNDIESNEDTVDMQGPIVEENRLTDQKRIILSINHDIENQTEKQTENGPGVLLTDIGNENVQKSLDLFDDEKICVANDTEEEKENKLAEKNHGFEEIRNEKHLPIQEEKASDDGTYVNNKNQHHVRATDTHENEQESLTHFTAQIEKNTVSCENLNFANEAQDNLCDFQKIDEVEENGEKLYNEYSHFNLYTDNTEIERKGDNQIFNRDTDYMNADDDLFCIIDDIELKIHTVEIHGPLLEEELLDDRSGTILFIDYKSENELERHSENGLGFSLTNIREENSQKGMDSFETEKIRVANDTDGQTQNETDQKNHGSEKSDNKWHISIKDDEASKVGKDVEIENQHNVRAIDTHKYQQDEQLEHSTKKIEKNTVPCENENFANKAQDNLCDLQKIDEVEENGDDVVLCLINDIKLSMDTVGVQASVREEKSLDDQTKFISTIYSDSKNKVGIEPRIESVFLLANIEKRNGQKEKNFIESMKICVESDTQENKINPLCTKYPGIEKINSKWSLPTLESNMLDSWEIVENENQQNVPVIDTHKCARSWKKPSSFLCVMSMKNLASIPKQRSTILTVFEKRLPIQVNRFELVNQAVSSNYKRINRTNTDLRSRKGFRIIREITPSISQYPYEQFSVRPVNRYDQLNNSRRFLNYGIYTQRNQSFTKLLDLSHYLDQIELESSPSKLCLKKTSQYLLPYFLGQLPSSSKRYARSFNYLSTSNCFPINRLNSKGGKPKFFISLQNKMTIETSWVKLTCTVFADPNPEVFWFKDGNRLSLYSSNHVVNIVNGVVTLEIYSVRPQDSGEYSCWARNMYGLASTEATLKVTSLYSRVAAVQTHINIVKKSHEYGFLIRRTRTDMDGLMNTYGYKNFSRSLFEMSRNSMKPATFVCRPLIKEIAIAINGCMRISFQMSGIPTPKVIVLRERRNIMYDRRLHHEIHNDYVMIRLERAQPSDEGSYCIIVQNCFGCDRHFFTMKVTKPSEFVRRDMSPWMKKSYDNRYGF